MKRSIALTIIVLIVSSLFSFPVCADSTLSPTVELTSTNANNICTVTVKLKGITTNLKNVQIVLDYDKSAIDFLSYKTNITATTPIEPVFSNENGELSFGWIANPTYLDDSNGITYDATGSVPLCTISFTSLKNANTSITINAKSLVTVAVFKSTELPSGKIDREISSVKTYIPTAVVPINVTYTAPVVTPTPQGNSPSGNGSSGGSTPVVPVVTPTPTPASTFTDLDGYDWASDSIYKLSKLGIIKGTSETTFSPANNITRADFAVLLSRTFNLKNAVTDNFNDVSADEYFYEPIGILKALGIAQGADGDYRPYEPITRQDIIVLTHRALTLLGYVKDSPDFDLLNSFNDKDEIADYATESVCVMIGRGIIKGNDGQLAPLNNATRAEAAVIFNRIYDILPK